MTNRYSLIVRRLRVILPITGILVLGITLLWPKLRPAQRATDTPSSQNNGSKVTGTTYQGVDGNGRPFTVSARELSPSLDMNSLSLRDATASLSLNAGGDTLSVSAPSGVYHIHNQSLTLTAPVNLVGTTQNAPANAPQNWRVTLGDIMADFAKGEASSAMPLTASTATATLSAQGVRVTEYGNRAVFNGPVKLEFSTVSSKTIPDSTP